MVLEDIRTLRFETVTQLCTVCDEAREPSAANMEAVAAQVKQLAGVASEAARKDIIIALRDLAASLESTDDTMDRIMYLVRQ